MNQYELVALPNRFENPHFEKWQIMLNIQRGKKKEV